MRTFWADVTIVAHAFWFLFIASGCAFSLLCIFFKSFRQLMIYRSIHVMCVLLNVVVFLAVGGCPMTILELDLRGSSLLARIPQSAIPYAAYRLLRLNLPPVFSIVLDYSFVIIPLTLYLIFPPDKFKFLFSRILRRLRNPIF